VWLVIQEDPAIVSPRKTSMTGETYLNEKVKWKVCAVYGER